MKHKIIISTIGGVEYSLVVPECFDGVIVSVYDKDRDVDECIRLTNLTLHKSVQDNIKHILTRSITELKHGYQIEDISE